jgi:hypothetical protein
MYLPYPIPSDAIVVAQGFWQLSSVEMGAIRIWCVKAASVYGHVVAKCNGFNWAVINQQGAKSSWQSITSELVRYDDPRNNDAVMTTTTPAFPAINCA